jgi:hypothetical protein
VAIEVKIAATEEMRELDEPVAPAPDGASAALAAATVTGAAVADGATDTGPCTPSSPLMSVSVAVEVEVLTVGTERVRALDDNPVPAAPASNGAALDPATGATAIGAGTTGDTTADATSGALADTPANTDNAPRPWSSL